VHQGGAQAGPLAARENAQRPQTQGGPALDMSPRRENVADYLVVLDRDQR
jgi:hypothetical protein